MQHSLGVTLQSRVTLALADWVAYLSTQSQPAKPSYEVAYEPIREIADRYTPEDHETLQFLAVHDPWLTVRDRDVYYDAYSSHKGEDLVIYENTYQHLISNLEVTLSG